jgi:Domain of unknown function (DUF1877)
MPRKGVFFAITPDELKQLEAFPDDEARKLFVRDVIEDAWDEDFTQEVGTSWEALHRCFGDGSCDHKPAATPLAKAIFGGRQLHSDLTWYVINLVEPAEVAAVAQALAQVTPEWLTERYNAIGPDSAHHNEQDKKDALNWFKGLPEFYARAAKAGRAVIFTVETF